MTPQGLAQGLRLAVKEVIHHNDILSPAIIQSGGDISARDPHSGDGRVVVKHDAEEGKAAIARQGRDNAAEEQIPAGIEVLDTGTRITVSALVNVCEDRAKTGDRRWFADAAWRDRHKEGYISDVAPDCAEQPIVAERGEGGPVARVVEQTRQPSRRELKWISGGRSLDKSSPRCGEECAARTLKARERASGNRRI